MICNLGDPMSLRHPVVALCQKKGLQLLAENAFSPSCTRFDSKRTVEKWLLIGCNNGGGGGNFWKVKLFVGKWIGRRKQLFRRQNEKSVSQWDVRNAGTFSQAYFTHTTTDCQFYAYLPTICPCSWAIEACKNIRIRAYFGLVTIGGGDISRHIAILRHEFKLAIFCIANLGCIFKGASCELTETLATLIPEKRQGFYPILLLHCYIPTTDSHELDRESSL